MRRNVTPTIKLALNISEAARSLGLRSEHIRDAILAGDLVCRQLGSRKRIPIFGPGGLQEWFTRWLIAGRAPRQRKQER